MKTEIVKGVHCFLCPRAPFLPGADPNLVDWQKFTPLHFAVSRGHRACVKELLEAGADANARTLSWNTALHLAAAM